MQRTIYYFSPPYSFVSNGSKLGYALVNQLSEAGFSAYAVCWEPETHKNCLPEKYKKITYEFNDFIHGKIALHKNDIVIYPEIITDNPLQAKNVVRYLLNRPWFLSNQSIQYSDTDLLIAYSKLVDKDLPQMFLFLDERELFTKIREEHTKTQKTVSIYFGKVNLELVKRQRRRLKRLVSHYQKVNIITRNYPPSREETLRTLSQSDLLITFDPLTNLNYEATLLDTPVLLMDDTYKIMSTKFNVPLFGFTDNEEELMAMAEEVQKSYACYCNFITNQNKDLVNSYNFIINHFDKLDKEQNYVKKIATTNKERIKIDFNRFKGTINNISYTNINDSVQLPVKIVIALGASHRNEIIKNKLHRKLIEIKKSIITLQFLKNWLKKIGLYESIKKVIK